MVYIYTYAILTLVILISYYISILSFLNFAMTKWFCRVTCFVIKKLFYNIVQTWLSVKAGIGNRWTEWGEWWGCGQSGWEWLQIAYKAICKSQNGESGNGMREIRVEMWAITVEKMRIRVATRGIRWIREGMQRIRVGIRAIRVRIFV